MKLTKKYLDAMSITRSGQGFYIWHGPDDVGGDIELSVRDLVDGEIETFDDLVYAVFKSGQDDIQSKIKKTLGIHVDLEVDIDLS